MVLLLLFLVLECFYFIVALRIRWSYKILEPPWAKDKNNLKTKNKTMLLLRIKVAPIQSSTMKVNYFDSLMKWVRMTRISQDEIKFGYHRFNILGIGIGIKNIPIISKQVHKLFNLFSLNVKVRINIQIRQISGQNQKMLLLRKWPSRT